MLTENGAGSGKEGIAIKYGEYYKVRGFSPALVCAGRFTAGVLHESRRCAEKAGIPFHGRYSVSAICFGLEVCLLYVP